MVIKRVLAALHAMLTGEDVPITSLGDLVMFSQTFVDRCHHGKEEMCLFPCLEQRGIPREGGPIGVMLMEHEMGRRLVRAIEDAVRRHEAGEASRDEVFARVREYVDLLEGHILKEEEVLFRMADHVMGRDDVQQTVACYERTEEERAGTGTHERMIAVAERMERDATGA